MLSSFGDSFIGFGCSEAGVAFEAHLAPVRLDVLGATTVDVSALLTARDGKTLLNSHFHGKVRFFGENLGVTNDLAKRIAKLLYKEVWKQRQRPQCCNNIPTGR